MAHDARLHHTVILLWLPDSSAVLFSFTEIVELWKLSIYDLVKKRFGSHRAVFLQGGGPQKFDLQLKPTSVETQHLPFCTSAVCQILKVCASIASSTSRQSRNRDTSQTGKHHTLLLYLVMTLKTRIFYFMSSFRAKLHLHWLRLILKRNCFVVLLVHHKSVTAIYRIMNLKCVAFNTITELVPTLLDISDSWMVSVHLSSQS